MVLEPDAVQSGCNSAELNAFSASGVENGGDSFAKDVLTLVVDWRFQTNFGVLDESNLADLVAESVDGSEGQQYEDLDADILRTGGVNAAGNQLQSSAQTDSFDDVDLDACVNAELLSMPLQLPKPIWDEVVWEAITGTLMSVDQLVPPCSRPAFFLTQESWLSQLEDSSKALKRKAETAVCELLGCGAEPSHQGLARRT